MKKSFTVQRTSSVREFRAHSPALGYRPRILGAQSHMLSAIHAVYHTDLDQFLDAIIVGGKSLKPRKGNSAADIVSRLGGPKAAEKILGDHFREFYKTKRPHELDLFEKEFKAFQDGRKTVD